MAAKSAMLFFIAAMFLVFSAAGPIPRTAPAFLWSPDNFGFSVDGAKEVVQYQTLSTKDLAKSVFEEGGWSNFVCSGKNNHQNVDIAVVFLGTKLQSSDISKGKQADPSLVDMLKLSFTSSKFSMAFPYVAISDEGTLEKSLISGFSENCGHALGANVKKHHDLDSINDSVVSRMEAKDTEHTDLIIFSNEGHKDLGHAKLEGEMLSELVGILKKSGARYTILYASEPTGFVQNPSHLPLGRYLAEQTNGHSSDSSKCDRVCQIKSSLLEGTFVGIVLLIILISGLMCMMGIDTPSRFEAPQD